MLCAILVIAINIFVNVKTYSFVVIYKRKVCAFRIVYLRFSVILLQLLYYKYIVILYFILLKQCNYYFIF